MAVVEESGGLGDWGAIGPSLGGLPPVRIRPPLGKSALDLIIGKSIFRGRGILVMLW
jgi:hypothetical protein